MSVEELNASCNSIDVQNLWKFYGSGKDSFLVLKDLTLNVPRGTIYGLLGPSGCGKTTLLRCLIGRLNFSRGNISVFGNYPGIYLDQRSRPTIGFMPQDITLNIRLTVSETVNFYGKVAGMSQREIDERCKFLLLFLGIEKSFKKYIHQLSGGQQRRVSLALALLHEPELLILDEPTVGVDPILRKKIWDYLNVLVNLEDKPVTIIITTHYIEEVALAHNVGMMLDGALLAQAPPTQLMQEHDCPTLEATFLKLCVAANGRDSDENEPCKDDWAEIRKLSVENNKEADHRKNFRRRNEFIKFPRFYRIQAFFFKDLAYFLRHIGLFILELLLPPAIFIVFSFGVGKSLYGLPIAIVNEDNQQLSLDYVNCINKGVLTQIFYDTYDEAQNAAHLGTVYGIVHLNPNFTISILNTIENGPFVDNTSLESSLIGLSLDLTSKQTAYTIQAELFFAFQRFGQKTIANMGLNPLLLDNLPFKFEEEQVYASLDMTFNQFLFPGFVLCIMFYIAMALTATTTIGERLSGNIERIIITGAESIELILGHILAHLVLMVAQIICLFIVLFPIFGYKCDGSYLLAAILAISQGLCGINYGFLLAFACSSETMLISLELATWFLAIASEGFLWPIDGMSPFIKMFSQLLPQTYPIEALRSIVNRGWGLYNNQIIIGFSLSLTWISIFLIMAWMISRKKI